MSKLGRLFKTIIVLLTCFCLLVIGNKKEEMIVHNENSTYTGCNDILEGSKIENDNENATNSKPEQNRLLENENNCHDHAETCGEGRENGYSNTFLETGCRNWEGFSFGNYGLSDIPFWIDMNSMNNITNTANRDLLINDIRTQIAMWNTAVMHDGTGQIVNLYEVGIGLNARPSDINGHQVVQIMQDNISEAGLFYGTNLTIIISYNPNGFGGRPGRNIDTPMHEVGHLLGLNDIDSEFDYGTHKTLMGYLRGTTESTLGDAITYHDIQGIAVLNNKHTTHQFTRYVYDGNEYLHFCFFCDIVDSENMPISGSLPMANAGTCEHNYQQMVSLGNKHWLKCTKCYKVVESDYYIHGVLRNGEVCLSIDGLIGEEVEYAVIPQYIGGNKVYAISANAFENNTALEIVNLSTGLEYINANAFKGCSSLSSITIPDNVTSIGYNAFKNCSNLSEVIVQRAKAPITLLDTNAFSGCSSSLQIKVPIDRIPDYKSAWASYGNKIYPVTNNFTTYYLDEECDYDMIVSLPNGYNKLYKLIVEDQETYRITCTSNDSIIAKLYNAYYSQITSSSGTITQELNGGATYYLSVECTDSSQMCVILTNIQKYNNHVHSYGSPYVWYDYTQHYETCSCGATHLQAHAVNGPIGPNQHYGTCIFCGGSALIGIVGPLGNRSYPTTINGSYILPNGVIVLVDEDIDSYMNGTLVFNYIGINTYRRNQSIPYATKKEEYDFRMIK